MLTKEEAEHLLAMLEELGNMVDYGCLSKKKAAIHKSACEKLEKISRGES